MLSKPDEQRPLIVVMSTVGDTRLYDLASQLQARAELLGCKFRAVNKEDFERALPKALTELLTHKEDAQFVAKWLDAWTDAITSAASEYRRDMRLLDLSDLAYLSKFRLDAESTTLGKYLNSMSATYVQFCIEKQLATARDDKLLDGLKFDKFPALHFLPSVQIPKLKHASSFLNDEVIKSLGYQFDNAKSVLQLGDLIVEKPKNWDKKQAISPDNMPVFVVISQACDVAQGKSDALLLLRGAIGRRDWTAAWRNPPENFIDILQFTPVQRMAAVMEVRPVRGDMYKLLVFNGDVAERISTIISEIDLTSVKDPFAGQIRNLAKSPDQLQTFNIATKLSQGLDFGSGLKIETKWLKHLDDIKDKDPRKTKLMMALTTVEKGGG